MNGKMVIRGKAKEFICFHHYTNNSVKENIP